MAFANADLALLYYYSSVSELHLFHFREVRDALLEPCCCACGMLVHPGGRWHGAFEHSEASELTLNSHSHYVTHGCHVRQPDAKLGPLLATCDNSLTTALLSEGDRSPGSGEHVPSLREAMCC